MSAIAVLIPILTQIGAPILKNVLQQSIGGKGADVAGDVIDAIAGRLGVEATPQAIEDAYLQRPQQVSADIQKLEAENGALFIALQSKAIDKQFELLLAETKAGGLKDALALGLDVFACRIWVWQIVAIATGTPSIATADLLQLTTWFLGLYMGGHTLKDFGKNIATALATRKEQ
ncbi:MAG: hypothetical protein U5K75_00215 [Ahrensia sp.]|nr:hypothetical protein [Ahrensia sp.]